MRILFAADVPPDPNSGAAGTEWQTIQALRRLGHEVDEIWAGDLLRKIRHGNIHYLAELPWRYRDAIQRRCSQREYDVIHVNQASCYLAAQDNVRRGRRNVFVYRSHGLEDRAELAIRPWLRRLGVRWRRPVATAPGEFVDLLLRRQYRLAAKWADGIIVSCSQDRDFLVHARRVDPDRVRVVPQAAPDSFLEMPLAIFDTERLRRVLHIGGFSPWKGSRTVVEAAALFLACDQQARLTWICPAGEHASTLEQFTTAVRERVNLVDWGTQDDLRVAYDSHGVLLAPSLFEGFGKVFLEAMSRGMCVVVTRTGGMLDLITSGFDGLTVDFHAPEKLAFAVQGLWRDAARARDISVHAVETARRYSWNRSAEETAAFYRDLQHSRGASDHV